MIQEIHWDLTEMFQNTEDWKKKMEITKEIARRIAGQKGHVGGNPVNLLKIARLYEELGKGLEVLFVYCKSRFDCNMMDGAAKNLYETAVSINTEILEQISFLAPELMQLTPEIFDRYCEQLPDLSLYKTFAQDFFAKKEHVLSSSMEELLVRMNNIGNSFRSVYDDLTVNDMEFPEITGPDGSPFKTSVTNYGAAMSDPDPKFRAEYLNTMLGVYGKNINTISSIYYGSVKNDVFTAKSRNYKSSRSASLKSNHIPEEVYDNLIETVKKNTKPLQDYVRMRKDLLGLKEIHFQDLFVPIVKDTSHRYTYDEAKQIVIESLAILGEDYIKIVKQAFEENWIDVYPASNKISGAYSTGAFGYHPIVLLNFNGTLDDIFTLAHELGHALHTYYSNQTQPFIYADYTLFCAEVASTLNEQLVSHYLLSNAKTNEEKALLLSKKLDDIRSTFYRQTMFADFEDQTHKLVEKGLPLLPEELCELHRKLNEIYYGNEFVADKMISYEWARIPHFYRAFYVYQYATGIAAAISISNLLLQEGEPGVENYRRFLTMGGAKHPIELLKIAGVDMTSPMPVLDTIEEFSSTLGELKQILIIK